jgi:hypothetical protein
VMRPFALEVTAVDSPLWRVALSSGRKRRADRHRDRSGDGKSLLDSDVR